MKEHWLFRALLTASIFLTNAVHAEELYPSSVVGTDFDFIIEDDPSTFLCLEYEDFRTFEMPDKRSKGNLNQKAFIFSAYFTDGTKIDIAMDGDFGDRATAEQDALRYTARLGKLPTLYRDRIRHIVVHKGGIETTAFAEDLGHFFVIYSDNATKRITTHDLEETFFHEGTHASIQSDHIDTAAWKNAQTTDGDNVTRYAGTNTKEDFAESALFAYTIIHHPERLPASDRVNIERVIPNRIAFFRNIYKTPLTYSVGGKHTCSERAAYPADAPSEVGLVVPTVDTAAPRTTESIPRLQTSVERPINFILFDALVLGLDQSEKSVAGFALEEWNEDKEYTDDAIIRAAADRFSVGEAVLRTEVEKWRHFDDGNDGSEATMNSVTSAGASVVEANTARREDSLGDEIHVAEQATSSVTDTTPQQSDSDFIDYVIAVVLVLILGVLFAILLTFIRHSRRQQQE